MWQSLLKMGNVLRYIARKSHEYNITDNDSLTLNRIMTAVLYLKVDRGNPVNYSLVLAILDQSMTSSHFRATYTKVTD